MKRNALPTIDKLKPLKNNIDKEDVHEKMSVENMHGMFQQMCQYMKIMTDNHKQIKQILVQSVKGKGYKGSNMDGKG